MISYVYELEMVKYAGFIMFVAFFSHHTRDATRRGFWIYPFGSTAPIPYGFYVISTCLIPYFTCWLNSLIRIENTVTYNLISVL